MKYLYLTEIGPVQSNKEPSEEHAVELEEGALYDIFKVENGDFVKAVPRAIDDARSIEWVSVEQYVKEDE